MTRLPPRSTRTDTLFPYTTLCRSRDLTLMDNNVVASPRFREIIAEIRDLGFEAGATLKRPGERTASKRRVDFNQGVDARLLCKDPRYQIGRASCRERVCKYG